MHNCLLGRMTKMSEEDILKILKDINSELGKPVTDELLEQIISRVIANPLDEDRGKCQDQIFEIITQRVGGNK